MPSCCVSDILGNTPVYVARAALYTAVTDRLRGVDTPLRRRYPSCYLPTRARYRIVCGLSDRTPWTAPRRWALRAAAGARGDRHAT